MKKKVRYILVFVGFVCTVAAQRMDKEELSQLRGRALALIEQDSFLEVARLLDQNLKRAKNEGLLDLEVYVYMRKAALYFELDDFDAGERYSKMAMKLSDSLQFDNLYFSTYGNLLHYYVLFGKDRLFREQLKGFDRLPKSDDHLKMYVDKCEVMQHYKHGNMAILEEKSREALARVTSGRYDEFFGRSKDYGKLKLRFITLFKMYLAYALSEMGTRNQERLQLLGELYKAPLEDILWHNSHIFEEKARVRKYLLEYYRNVSPNKDSIAFYLNELERTNKERVRFLEEKSARKSTYLTSLLERERELENTQAQLSLGTGVLKEGFLILALTLLVLLGTVGFFVYSIQSSRFKINAARKLVESNRRLKDNINKKLALEGMLEHVQDTITMDMYSSFGHRLSDIRVSVRTLKSIKEKKEVGNPLFNTFFETIEKGVAQVATDIDDLVWSNNSQNNRLSSVIKKLKEFSQDIERAHDGRKIVFLEEYDHDYRLQRFWNRQLLLIFKEAINNAFKYANSDVTLWILVRDGELTIICRDEGTGFDMESLHRRSGVSNMAKRAQSIGCTLEIQSGVGFGTTVTFTGKLDREGVAQ